jgi:hypothetical protein
MVDAPNQDLKVPSVTRSEVLFCVFFVNLVLHCCLAERGEPAFPQMLQDGEVLGEARQSMANTRVDRHTSPGKTAAQSSAAPNMTHRH